MAPKPGALRLFKGGAGPKVEDENLLHRQEDGSSSTPRHLPKKPLSKDAITSGSSRTLIQGESNDSYAEIESPSLTSQSGNHGNHLPPHKTPLNDQDANPQGAGAGAGGDGQGTNGGELSLREVYFNDTLTNSVNFAKCTNVVVTSKYTVLTFLPKFLFESFCKVANFFFLVVCVLQSIKAFSNTYGMPTNAPVLTFVIAIDAVFAIMEDKRRHRSDHEANSATCHIIRDGQIEDKLWSDVQVGDFLQIRNREIIPADVLILAVSEPVGEAASGICYVETKSLDGETNLKLRQAIPATMSVLVNPQELNLLSGVIKYELPNPYIDKFAGKVEVQVDNCGVEVMPLSAKNILLRGCNLRNTDWVYGIVLNTGDDTKIMQSASPAPTKWSDLMKMINKMILIMCALLFTACAVAATLYDTWQFEMIKNTWYIINPDVERSKATNFVVMLFYYFLLLYQVIPISLYVSMTTVKFLQAMFMAWDREMYHEETDTPAIVRTMALNEELGQISYVFTDKTGTLTCNIMEFRKCSINGVSYGSGLTEIGRAALLRAGKAIPEEPNEPLDGRPKMPYVNFNDKSLFDALNGQFGEDQKQKVFSFFEHLAICHTVIPEKLENGEIRLSASSPDEQALVAGAAYVGFSFENRSVGRATVNVLGTKQTYEVLEVLEFNSTRKRMSVVVRRPDGNLVLYCKGADMMIYQRLRKDSESGRRLQQVTKDHMEQFADDGLRTLALAVKPLDEKMFRQWKQRFDDAMGDVQEIDKRKDNKPNRIDDLMEEIEMNLELIGATAIEDKLQDGVPLCLSHLTAAGIKVWMLTGDKEETAINIGYACSLLDNSIQQVIINMGNCPNEEAICLRLRDATKEFTGRNDASAEIALIIDGEALQLALRPTTMMYLLEFSRLCRAVICNRVSPAQKAEMVCLVRDNLKNVRTLAIGDGANDVAMIQAAHVGVGISGQEGMQAVNSSDYAIAQFRFLERLLLVHGRWNYIRVSRLVLYMFYKNITLVFVSYWYGFTSGASGAKLFWELGVQVYNVLFTGLPIVALGVMDKDLPAHYSLDYPQLYRKGIERAYFNYFSFLRWIMAAVFESFVVFLSVTYWYNASEGTRGSESRVEYGMVAFTLTVFIVNLKICLIMDNWNIVSALVTVLSVVAWFLYASMGTQVAFFGRIKIGYDEFGSFVPTANSFGYMLVIVIGCVIALGRHFSWNQYQRIFYPTLSQLLQEKHNLERRQKRRLTIAQQMDGPTLSMSLDEGTRQQEIGAVYGGGPGHGGAGAGSRNGSGGHHVAFGQRAAGVSGSTSGSAASSGSDTHVVSMPVATLGARDSEEMDGMIPIPRDREPPLLAAMDSGVYDVDQYPTHLPPLPPDRFGSSRHGMHHPGQLAAGGTTRTSSFNTRTTGFAFSCDEETTLAEGYIASNSILKSEAVPRAHRNSSHDRSDLPPRLQVSRSASADMI